MSVPARDELLRLTLAAAPAAVAMFDTALRFITCSESGRLLFGATGPVVGCTLAEALPHLPPRLGAAMPGCMSGASEVSDEDCFTGADGSTRYASWRLDPWHLPDGSIGGALLFATDVTAAVLHRRQARLLADGLDHAGFGLVICDGTTHRIIYANPEFSTQHRLPPGAAIGMLALDTYAPPERARLLQSLQSAGPNATMVQEIERLRADGSTFASLTTITLVSDADGPALYRVGTVLDISAHKQAEAARTQAESDLSMLVDLAPGVLYQARLTGGRVELLHAHGNFRQISERGDIAAVAEILDRLDSNVLLRRLAALPGQEAQSVDWQVQEPGGHIRWLRNNARVTRRGAEAELTGYLTDVTLEVAARRRLPQEEAIGAFGEMAASFARHIQPEALRQFVETLPAGLAILDRSMTYLAASGDYRALLGLQDQDLTGRSYYDVFPEMTESRRAAHRLCLAGATRQVKADPYLRANGEFGFWDWEMRPWYDAGGEQGGVAITIRNVTDSVHAQHDLRRYIDGLETANIGISIADEATGALIYVNPEYAAMHGRSIEAARNLQVLENYPPGERAFAQDRILQAQQQGRVVYEALRQRADGTVFPALVALTVVPGSSDTPPYRIGTVLDLTALKQAQAGHRAAQGELSTLLAFGPGILCRKRIAADGLEAVEIHGDRMRLAVPGETAADVDALVMAVLRHADTAALLHRLAQLADGDTGTVDVMVAAPGQPERWIRNAVHVVGRTSAGTEMAGYMTDVTREVIEQTRLHRAATLVTLGEMSASMAHELRQPLTSISYAAQNARHLLGTAVTEAGRVEAKLEKIITETARASKLIDHMRVFGRNEPSAPVACSWQQALKGALELLAARKTGIAVDNLLPAELPQVMGAPIMMEQVLINLLGNAFDAYEAQAQPAEAALQRVVVSGGAEDGAVVLCVADHAGGVPEALLPRMFQPFVTTKPPGSGTGLGLAMCYATIVGMGGTLSVHNESGGAVFEIRVPAATP